MNSGINIDASPQSHKSGGGSVYLTGITITILVAAVVFIIHDRETHGKRWIWHRIREENDLRERTGQAPLSPIEAARKFFSANGGRPRGWY
ncbi:hypothetical protein JW935_22400 [candidate division KSB1 bacterium]|nr:hypothetical protein [candidate division KSB1 bacterium]